VVASGGWDDVFAEALSDVIADAYADVKIRWCFNESDDELIGVRYQALFERLSNGILTGSVLFYRGVDCHTLFGEVRAELATLSPARQRDSSPLLGWRVIDDGFLDALTPLRDVEVVRFFDGALPTWRHAICDGIPRRAVVQRVISTLGDLASDKSDSSLQLIRSAAGEGKSTALLQAAADAARSGRFRVLWRPSPAVGVRADRIASLDRDCEWLIVSDDAADLISELAVAMQLLHEDGRSNVHFLLAARDTDWRLSGGGERPWASSGLFVNAEPLRGLTISDAEAITEAWATYGEAGLRKLSDVAEQARAATLYDAVAEAERAGDEGSFFGGLLSVRFDAPALHAHVRDLIARLQVVPIRDCASSLADALIFISAAHSVDLPGIDEHVLADLLGVPTRWIYSRVIRPLGEEIGTTTQFGCIATRHRRVASSIISVADLDFVDVADVWARMARQNKETGTVSQVVWEFHSALLHPGPMLVRMLPSGFSRQRRKKIALAATDAAAAAHSASRLDFFVDYAAIHRLSGDPATALEVLRKHYAEMTTAEDYYDNARGFFCEWALDEAAAERSFFASALLYGIALSDQVTNASLTGEDMAIACAGLGNAFSSCDVPPADARILAEAVRATTAIARATPEKANVEAQLELNEVKALILAAAYPQNLDQAVMWIERAFPLIEARLDDTFVAHVKRRTSALSFLELRRLLRRLAR
jgi:hypothetical protein